MSSSYQYNKMERDGYYTLCGRVNGIDLDERYEPGGFIIIDDPGCFRPGTPEEQEACQKVWDRLQERLKGANMISNLTKEKRNQVIKKLKKLTGFKVVQSRTLLQRIANYFKLQGARKLLLEMGVEEADEFLAKRFIYMPIGKKHYLFAPRSLTEGTVGQFMDNVVTLAHEFDHKLRFGKDGPIQYRRRYIGNKWDRADYEGSAYGAGADIDWKFGRNARLNADVIFDEDFEKMYILDVRHANAAKAVFRKVAENRPQRFGTEAGARVWAVVEEVLEG